MASLAGPTGSFFCAMRDRISLPRRPIHPDVISRSSQSPKRGDNCEIANNRRALAGHDQLGPTLFASLQNFPGKPMRINRPNLCAAARLMGGSRYIDRAIDVAAQIFVLVLASDRARANQ